MQRIILVLCLISAYLGAEELTVYLGTESKLYPLYCSTITADSSSWSKDYINQMNQVLLFDLNHNGHTQVVTHKDAPYKVSVEIVNNQLKARAADAKQQTATRLGGLQLTGDINRDRASVHRLADAICKALFGEEGIAACRFLYTVKTKPQGDKQIAEVYEADYDGGNVRQLTREKSLCVTPTYLPPKKGYAPDSFLYVSYRNGQPKIYIAPLKGGEGERLLSLRGNQFMPVISTLCDKLAFVSDISGKADLFLQLFDTQGQPVGKPRQIFTAFRSTEATPTLSPDGKKVAFVSNKDGAPRIYMMDIPMAGSDVADIKPTLLSKHNKESTSPAWSPDGQKIAYSSMAEGVRQIWIYDLQMREEFALTLGGHNKENPVWAPDSLHILYNSADNQMADIYLIDLHKKEPVKITKGPGEKRFPSWQPR